MLLTCAAARTIAANPHEPVRIVSLAGHTSTVRRVAFSPDGGTLATAGVDAALWDVRWLTALPGHLTDWACQAAGEGLAEDRWRTAAPGIPYQTTC